MNCELFQPIVADLARNQGLMDAAIRSAAEAHASKCEDCAQTLIAQKGLTDALGNLSREMKDLQAPTNVESQLRAAFRNQTAVASVATTPRRWRYAIGAVAAMLLAAFVLLGLWARRTTVTPDGSPAPQAGVKTLAGPGIEVVKQTNSAPIVTPPQFQPATSRNQTPQRRRHLNKPTSASIAATPVITAAPVLPTAEAEREVATDFVPVGYGSALDLQDGGQLVRVELPRFALARFGLPLNMDRADEDIKADVLVGADGLARAIRFVR
jgi:hypothetical protein